MQSSWKKPFPSEPFSFPPPLNKSQPDLPKTCSCLLRSAGPRACSHMATQLRLGDPCLWRTPKHLAGLELTAGEFPLLELPVT